MNKQVLLAFDTSTAAVTVALHDGESVVGEHTRVDPLRHGELLAPAISSVLAAAGVRPHAVTEIAVGVGPGPFTGLRVGVVTALAMGSSLGVPVRGVCSLDILAAAGCVHEPFLVVTDARRKEVYWAGYAAGGARLTAAAVALPASIATDLPVAGRGAVLYPEAFPFAVPPEYPSAAELARAVAESRVQTLPPAPLYLRRPDVASPGPRKPVS